MRTFFALLLVLMLSACAGDPVVQIKTVAELPPDNLLVDCTRTPPPAVVSYMALPIEDREGLLSDLYVTQDKNAVVCNVRLNTLRNWKKDKQAQYATPTIIKGK